MSSYPPRLPYWSQYKVAKSSRLSMITAHFPWACPYPSS